MRDLNLFPDRRTDFAIIDYYQRDMLLYGFKQLEQQPTEPVARCYVPAEAFVALLRTHFPNYGSVRKLLDFFEKHEVLDYDLLRAVSYQVKLERGDCDYLNAGSFRWVGKGPDEQG